MTTELIKSLRYYKYSLSGLNPTSIKSHKWALSQTLQYRKSRKHLIKSLQLGYYAQVKNRFRALWNQREITEQNERYQEYMRNQQIYQSKISQTLQTKQEGEESCFRPEIKIKRVDYYKEVKTEEDYQRKQKFQTFLFTLQMKLQAFYYSLNVQTLATKLGNFLKLYHESLQGLVQGYRETTMDAKGEFKFEEDGMSVEERLQKYENKLHEYSTGLTKEIQKKRDEQLSANNNKQSLDAQTKNQNL